MAFQQEQCEEATHGDTSCSHSHSVPKLGSGKVMELLKVLQADARPVRDLGKCLDMPLMVKVLKA